MIVLPTALEIEESKIPCPKAVLVAPEGNHPLEVLTNRGGNLGDSCFRPGKIPLFLP